MLRPSATCQIVDVADAADRGVEHELGVEAAEAVLQVPIRQVVPAPRGSRVCTQVGQSVVKPHGGGARLDDLLRRTPPSRPRSRAAASGSSPAFSNDVLVVVQDRRRGVERQGQHVAVGVGVVADDRRRERPAGSNGSPVVGHQLVDRIDRRPWRPSWCRCRPRTPGRCAGCSLGAESGDRRRSSSRDRCPCRPGTTL